MFSPTRLRAYLVLLALVLVAACDSDKEDGGLKFRADTDATPHRGVFGLSLIHI